MTTRDVARALRIDLGLTQAQLAAHFGVSRKTVIENEQRPEAREIWLLALVGLRQRLSDIAA